MDKNKAMFIYTAITRRNRDPGLVIQTSPSSYQTQVYPLAIGHDFRLKLTNVGFLQPSESDLKVPEPRFKGQPYPQEVLAFDPTTIQVGTQGSLVKYETDPYMDLQVYAQKYRDGYTYIAGIIRTDKPNAPLALSGIHKVYWSRPEERQMGASSISSDGARAQELFESHKETISKRATTKRRNTSRRTSVEPIPPSCGRIKSLSRTTWKSRMDVLNFSLKYQVPSTQTALLAVPQQEMKLFREKAAEYRRLQAQEARRERAWQQQRRTNWSTSAGGDPEIRILNVDASRAYAVLPDGRTFDLQKDRSGYWGGNFDIPAHASEGTYQVRIFFVDRFGRETEQSVSYDVDRTAPTGTLKIEDGFLVLRSEPGLAKVVVVLGDGKEETMIEYSPGVYKFSIGVRRVVRVHLIDKAHNVTELAWSN